MRRRRDRPLGHRKARDRAAILPLIAVLLLMPPVAGIFRLEATVGGVPFLLVYLFGVWALLIAGTALLSRPLAEADASTDEGLAGGAGEGGPDGRA